MTTENNTPFKINQFVLHHRWLLLSILVALFIRIAVNLWLNQAGYFYGVPWDSFTRTAYAYQWAGKPFFAPGDGYWLALQFWLAGSLFALLKPVLTTSNILVLVGLNHLFFIGSLILVYQIAKKIGGTWSGIWACLLASVFAGDVFVTYTALSEPISIFFSLLASSWFVDYLAITEFERRSTYAVRLGAAAFFAAANHYIGWYLAGFLGLTLLVDFTRHLHKASTPALVRLALAMLLCGLMPVLWLLNSYVMLGDITASLKLAKNAQSAYIGQMPLIRRMIVIPKVMFQEFQIVSLTGLAALGFWAVKSRKTLLYLAPPAFTMGVIWLSTSMALSAPYQEPRYLVFAGWSAIPFIAALGVYLWQRSQIWLKLIPLIMFSAFFLLNISDITHFRNSFDVEIKKTAEIAGKWIERQSGPGRKVILEQTGFIEQIVIPISSGRPERFILYNKDQEEKILKDPLAWFDKKAPGGWLAITRSKDIAHLADIAGIKRTNLWQYYILESK